MRRHLLSAILSAAVASTTCSAQAGGGKVEMQIGSTTVRMEVIQNLESSDPEYSRGQLGHYVFIASALPDGVIQVSAIEEVASCTGVRPHFGLTKPTPGYFRFPAYAVYYGPYATKQDAVEVRQAVAECVPDAYNKPGVIQRF